jgi:hypothetical protein
MEEELVTLDTTTVEADWLSELFGDLPIVEKPLPAILMNRDNQSRHFNGQYEVRKIRNFGVITMDYIQTNKNPTDLFTKGLSCTTTK